jgi:hypothetical protein
MALMGFLRNIRGLLGGAQKKQDAGLYLYVKLYKVPSKPSADDEVVQLRIHTYSEVSEDDDGQHFIKKTVVGSRTFRRAEITLFFDEKRNVRDHEITGGELTTEDEFRRYENSFSKPS